MAFAITHQSFSPAHAAGTQAAILISFQCGGSGSGSCRPADNYYSVLACFCYLKHCAVQNCRLEKFRRPFSLSGSRAACMGRLLACRDAHSKFPFPSPPCRLPAVKCILVHFFMNAAMGRVYQPNLDNSGVKTGRKSGEYRHNSTKKSWLPIPRRQLFSSITSYHHLPGKNDTPRPRRSGLNPFQRGRVSFGSL